MKIQNFVKNVTPFLLKNLCTLHVLQYSSQDAVESIFEQQNICRMEPTKKILILINFQEYILFRSQQRWKTAPPKNPLCKENEVFSHFLVPKVVESCWNLYQRKDQVFSFHKDIYLLAKWSPQKKMETAFNEQSFLLFWCKNWTLRWKYAENTQKCVTSSSSWNEKNKNI